MQIVNHPFIKFDRLKPVYNFTYPLFRTISEKQCKHLDYDNLIKEFSIPAPRSVSLYLHIPFCETICSFCPFQKGAYKHADQVDAYVNALCLELRKKADFVKELGGPVKTIYMGGGTPSILSPHNLEQIGQTLKDYYDLSELKEFTFECEPKSVTREKLQAAAAIGANRVSFGVQTFTDRYRSLFDITSTREDIENTVNWSQEIIGRAGFDMLYGMHGQTPEEFLYDLKCATDLSPETINLYPINNIAITPKLHKAYAAQNMQPTSLPHRQMLRYFGDTVLRGCDYAPCNGHSYIKGENTKSLNIAGMSSANYFRYHKYLHGYHDDYVIGFGSSAQSIMGTLVTRANPNRTDYINHIPDHGGPKCHYDMVSPEQLAAKAIAMRLPYNGYLSKDRVDWSNIPQTVKTNLQKIIEAGMISDNGKQLEITTSGWQWYSNLMYYLLPEADQQIVNDYVNVMMQSPVVTDGTGEILDAA